jgi:uncharacterized protein (DUF433 family)
MTTTSKYLASDPAYRGGRMCIKGTGITVGTIGVHTSEGLTPDQICRDVFANAVSLRAVEEAVDYYLANRERIDAEVAHDDAEIERVAAEYNESRARTA